MNWQAEFDRAWDSCDVLRKETSEMAARSWYTKGRVAECIYYEYKPGDKPEILTQAAFNTMRSQYEEEIERLKRELEESHIYHAFRPIDEPTILTREKFDMILSHTKCLHGALESAHKHLNSIGGIPETRVSSSGVVSSLTLMERLVHVVSLYYVRKLKEALRPFAEYAHHDGDRPELKIGYYPDSPTVQDCIRAREVL